MPGSVSATVALECLPRVLVHRGTGREQHTFGKSVGAPGHRQITAHIWQERWCAGAQAENSTPLQRTISAQSSLRPPSRDWMCRQGCSASRRPPRPALAASSPRRRRTTRAGPPSCRPTLELRRQAQRCGRRHVSECCSQSLASKTSAART